ncbi:8-oxo-dGTP pyrophosphatase MutT (NUDIX family) [Hamadaea flava]|nr:NUDIX domain-containing protein [Hamadaea flava]MCP2328650.1 8-oxo-dGTP pyrophosphatase MutT (NUDIX family) [Hamadaea flava]
MSLYESALAALTEMQPADDGQADWRTTLDLVKSGPEALRRERDGGHVTASALVYSRERDAFLLSLHRKFGIWVQLGGHVDATDETLAAAALREATEEGGIADLVVDPVPVDVDVHEVPNCAGRRLLHHDVMFLMYAPAGAAERISDESLALGWFSVDDLPSPRGTDVDRVLRNALARISAGDQAA